jgi:ABC-type Fe3+-hydroxamate transport system substrate-binding protein
VRRVLGDPYAAQLDAMPSVGHRQSPNLESIAALQPDLIMANAAASQDIHPTLSAIAPTVLVQGTGVKWKQDFLLLADSLGVQGTGQSYLDTFRADAKAVGDRAGDRTVSFVRITTDRTRVFGVPSFTGFTAWDAGLARPPPGTRSGSTTTPGTSTPAPPLPGWCSTASPPSAARGPTSAAGPARAPAAARPAGR